MSRYSSADEARKERIEAMGPDLGPIYDDLYNEVVWLHFKWQQSVVLFGTDDGRSLLNQSAGSLFRVIQDVVWEECLLHLCRLTDRLDVNRKGTLSVRRLPRAIADEQLRSSTQSLVDLAVQNPNLRAIGAIVESHTVTSNWSCRKGRSH